MELTQQMLDIPIEHMSNVFGKFDAWLKQIEKISAGYNGSS